jgi:alpha-L-fucosidase
MKNIKTLVLLQFLILSGVIYAQDRSTALQNWHNNKYSMFIHFGVYSELGGVWQGKPVTRGYSEQIQAHAGILTDIYDEVPSSFNPVKWDAAEIVSLAKKAGMRSIVITSKHHDGFCMYHSAYTRFNVLDATLFKRDIIGELAGACRKSGINFGLYYSLIDYRLHPMASSNANPITPDHHEYNKKQITELLSNYGPISEMWFDMGSLTALQSREIYELVHRLQPDCMVSGRLGNDAYDFCVMGDNEYPDYKIDTPWQTPASMFDETWGYRSWQKREDVSAKTTEKLLSLIKVVSRGGNYLLNIGPKGDGTVVPFEAEVLNGIGKWLTVNGEAIYGTSANPLTQTFAWGEITTSGNCLYLILSGNRSSTITLPSITGKVKLASLLTDPKTSFPSSMQKGNLTVQLPETLYTSPEIQVIKLEFEGNYQIKPERLMADKELKLDFHNAIKHYSYSCIDYYNNHRSIVRQEWNFVNRKKGAVPELFYTAEEAGKALELSWNGAPQVVLLKDGEPTSVNPVPGTIQWENRYVYGPIDADFQGNPGAVKEGIDPQTDWHTKNGAKWSVLPDWQNGKVVSIPSKPIQQQYILQEISSDRIQNQLIEIGSGDGIQVWLNGENLVFHNNPRGAMQTRETVLLPLKRGKNQLLIKLYNRYGYEIAYSINHQVPQTLYRKKLSPLPDPGFCRCTMKLYQPASIHQPIRMNNVRLKL